MAFVIANWSRSPQAVSYNGPACAAAGVIGGQVYQDRAEAESDARRLSDVNPVKFLVYEVPSEPEP